MFYESILRKLSEAQIKYLVIGGVAINFHGYKRPTHDLDIFILLDNENINKFASVMRELHFKPRVPVEIEEIADKTKREKWISEKNMKVFSLYNTDNEIDIIDVMIIDYLNFEEAYRNRKIINIKDFKVPLASIPDLIKLKQVAGRPRDLIDIKVLSEMEDITYEN
ncbi:MAG: hypothetical protein A3I68_06420 [Candidatus Melainabacteria bacterium RIFCSPLOWO2_02_FULL_35_15]|nr:MAG: hypothetical protein A3F80_08005 [Candidatus Melainabacteria bacterium RIFCSPLOWO2_12_FULL_35_11]OGI14598.1 MAG: hypothetical protein A3I68_06420 [Candidatus Melainabacteria bacterium RIFCSPLOWO2_02_FULL_35_15]